MKLLYENEGLTEELFRVFMVYVASSGRPMHELLAPAMSWDRLPAQGQPELHSVLGGIVVRRLAPRPLQVHGEVRAERPARARASGSVPVAPEREQERASHQHLVRRQGPGTGRFAIPHRNAPPRGETEFRHQAAKVTPEEGKLLLFPPFWTHEHRGVVLERDVKYIATTWVVFA